MNSLAAASVTDHVRARARTWRVGVCVAAWLVTASVFATQFTLGNKLSGRQHDVGWLHYFANELVGWGFYLVAVPLIVSVSRRFPLVGVRTRVAVRNLAVHAFAASAMFAVMAVVGTIFLHAVGVLNPPYPLGQLILVRMGGSFAAGWLIYGAIVLLHHALMFYDAFRARETRAAQLEAALTHAQLDALRMQLQPHFLFNTLHAISGLMGRDVQAARRMMSRLSDLLRFSLESDATQEVPLSAELEFLARYVQIQEMRFEDRLTVDVDVEPAAEGVAVPRLLLQPLVENAIRHGISRVARGGLVELRGRVRDGRLRLEVQDDGAGLGLQPLVEGVGLRNTRERLRQLYGDAQEFAIGPRPGGGTIVVVEIPARAIGEATHGAIDAASRRPMPVSA